MKSAQNQHVVESLADWGAPAILGAAAGWAAFRLGVSFAGVAALAVAAAAIGTFVMRKAGAEVLVSIAPFETAEIERFEPELEELLLEAKDELLILDDPLVEPALDSRVVQLFARPEPTPGELVERIVDFLGEGRRPAPDSPQSASNPPVADASTSLHAALANIRASLR